MDRLSGVLRSRGHAEDLPEAAQLRREVLRYRVDTFGLTHPETLRAMNNLGTVLMEQEDWAEAEIAFKNVIPMFATRNDEFGFGNPTVLLGALLTEQQRYDEAEDFFRKGIAWRESFFGKEHPLTLSAIRKCTRMLVESESYDSALPMLEDCSDRHNKAAGSAAGATFGVRQSFSRTLIGLGRLDAAESFLQETATLMRTNRGVRHPYTRTAAKQLDDFRRNNDLSGDE